MRRPLRGADLRDGRHRPRLIGPVCAPPRLRFAPLVVPAIALDVAQMQKHTPLRLLAVRRSSQSAINASSSPGTGLWQVSLIPNARQASAILPPAVLAISRRCHSEQWCNIGPSKRFLSKSFCMLNSAYMRFRRRFFSAISISSDVKDASIPSNLARHL